MNLGISTKNRITNSGFTYDNAGNLTADGVYSYSWNAENRLTSTNGVNYTYDGAGGTFATPANNGITLGVRAPGQSWSSCMAANSGNYSINGILPSSMQNGATRLLLNNDAGQILFGDSSEGTAGLVVWEGGSRSVEGGVGEVMTAGRRTASIFDLNLSGRTGPAPKILAKTGTKKLAGFLTGAAELKMAIDAGLTGAAAIGCLIPQ